MCSTRPVTPGGVYKSSPATRTNTHNSNINSTLPHSYHTPVQQHKHVKSSHANSCLHASRKVAVSLKVHNRIVFYRKIMP